MNSNFPTVGRDLRIPPSEWVGVGFHTDAMSPIWKSVTTFGGIADPARQSIFP